MIPNIGNNYWNISARKLSKSRRVFCLRNAESDTLYLDWAVCVRQLKELFSFKKHVQLVDVIMWWERIAEELETVLFVCLNCKCS